MNQKKLKLNHTLGKICMSHLFQSVSNQNEIELRLMKEMRPTVRAEEVRRGVITSLEKVLPGMSRCILVSLR